MKIVIVGAGISGLAIAKALQQRPSVEVQIFEKSKGVGGRLATRRFEHGAFDHGAQFYSLSPATESLHRQWITKGSAEYWFEDRHRPKFRGHHGMTSIAKMMADSLKIDFATKIIGIGRKDNRWLLELEDKDPQWADQVVLTVPLPQALELLTASQIAFPEELSSIHYAKALVGLFQGSAGKTLSTTPWGYLEPSAPNPIFSITDLQKKGMATKPAFTVTMSPDFSEKYFADSDEVISDALCASVLKYQSDFAWTDFQLKKWRYSHPLTIAASPSMEIAPGLSLVGDAFGGPSISGALRSAQAWLQAQPSQ